MKPNYIRVAINDSLLFMKNIEEKEKRHECDTLVFNKDITNLNTKLVIDETKN